MPAFVIVATDMIHHLDPPLLRSCHQYCYSFTHTATTDEVMAFLFSESAELFPSSLRSGWSTHDGCTLNKISVGTFAFTTNSTTKEKGRLFLVAETKKCGYQP
jgi:hypothetical protein